MSLLKEELIYTSLAPHTSDELFSMLGEDLADKGYINPYNKSWTIENKVFRPLLFTVLPFIGGFVSRVFDVSTDVFVFIVNRLFCKSVPVPQTFLYGKPETEADVIRRNSRVSITRSLSYSLLLFGLGLVCTLLYLLIAEFRV